MTRTPSWQRKMTPPRTMIATAAKLVTIT
jgi:hypothetical protein